MTLVQPLKHRFIRDREWLIRVHRDLFKNDAPLFIKVCLSQRWSQNVRQDFEGWEESVRNGVHVIRSELVTGVRVVVRAEIVEVSIHLLSRASRCSFEHHVLKKV